MMTTVMKFIKESKTLQSSKSPEVLRELLLYKFIKMLYVSMQAHFEKLIPDIGETDTRHLRNRDINISLSAVPGPGPIQTIMAAIPPVIQIEQIEGNTKLCKDSESIEMKMIRCWKYPMPKCL
jgi:hypothetical protein